MPEIKTWTKEKQAAFGKKWRERNKEYLRAYREARKEQRAIATRKNYEKRKTEWQSILQDRGMLECINCGYNKCFAALDYHHVEPWKKEYRISRLIVYKPTPDKIAELDKVIPLCKNCHTEFHVEGKVNGLGSNQK